ncbi:uncharacterized protein LOC116266541 [Nymphaea colorata]|nr:uncharacterized protein LOC116266541 [Nymphaea colorata]
MALSSTNFLLLFLLLFLGSHSPSKAVTLRPPFWKSWWPRRSNERFSTYQYETRYFTQTLDHFSFKQLGSFQQRYLLNQHHWSGALRMGPIFFYCGNEGGIEWFAENTGFMWDIAPRFGAMLVFAEHRYYGQSLPYGSREKAYQNADTLSYLTAEQALADFATLVIDLKRNFSAEACPVILFGGSYGGMLAAWMRMKYPHIAVGALSSSAPILQFQDIVPSQIFYDIVSNDFKRESLSCFKCIKESWNILEHLGQTSEGLANLSRRFNLCWKLNRTQDLADWLSSAYSYLAMVNYPYPANFLMPLPAFPIKEVCKRMDSYPDGTGILDRIFGGISIYYNYTGSVDCFDIRDDPHGMNGWNWQACTEMVMPMSSNEESSMFPPYCFDYDAYQDQCIKEFGVRPRPKWITTEFGGHDLERDLKHFGSNIIFANGLLDPWSGGGVLQNVSDSIISLVTEEGAHHLDLRAATDQDPEWLVDQRESEVEIIRGWISDYYTGKASSF